MSYDTDINNEKSWKPPRPQVNTTIDARIHRLAKENSIQWNDALEFGIIFLLAERDIGDHPPNSLSEKIKKMSALLNQQDAEEEAKKILEGFENEGD